MHLKLNKKKNKILHQISFFKPFLITNTVFSEISIKTMEITKKKFIIILEFFGQQNKIEKIEIK